jgi:hypothetical protein
MPDQAITALSALTAVSTNDIFYVVDEPDGGSPADKKITAQNLHALADDFKSFYGTDNDASIHYDGSDLIINPQEDGTGDVVIETGNLTTSTAVASSGPTIANTALMNGSIPAPVFCPRELTSGIGSSGGSSICFITNSIERMKIGDETTAKRTFANNGAGNNQKTFQVETTLNDTIAAVGVEDFSLIKGQIIADSTAGWTEINYINLGEWDDSAFVSAFRVERTGSGTADMKLSGRVFIKEQSTAGDDVDNYGRLWVNSANDDLYFTSEGGTETRLTGS